MAEPCACGRIMVGGKPTGDRNWHPDCPEHGTESEWWERKGKVAHEEQRRRSVELQRRAREARRKAREG